MNGLMQKSLRQRGLDLQSPTRYCYDLASDARGSWRRKKNHRLGDIFAFGPALQIFWFHRGNVGRRIHKSWRDGIDADTEVPALKGQGAGQSLNHPLWHSYRQPY